VLIYTLHRERWEYCEKMTQESPRDFRQLLHQQRWHRNPKWRLFLIWAILSFLTTKKCLRKIIVAPLAQKIFPPYFKNSNFPIFKCSKWWCARDPVSNHQNINLFGTLHRVQWRQIIILSCLLNLLHLR
jgi:hypothetical protein